MWHRVRVSAWVGTALVVVLVAVGVRGLGTLVAYFLAVVAAGTALRTLGGNLRAARERGAAPWRGLLGRSSGGMVVHLGVVLATVGIVSSVVLRHARRGRPRAGPDALGRRPQRPVPRAAHRRATRSAPRTRSSCASTAARVFYPAVTQFAGRSDQRVGTPAIDSSWLSDVYLTFDAISTGSAVVQPPAAETAPGGLGGARRHRRAAGRVALGRRAPRRHRRGALAPADPRAGAADQAVVPADVAVRELEAV